jgi:N-acetylglucosaminyldiphosphoundecaprenol N-acetyl-beta-D-mannosaminyltransferase
MGMVFDEQWLQGKVGSSLASFTVGSIPIACVNRATAVERCFQLVRLKTGGFITVRDAHGIVEAQGDQRLRGILLKAQLNLPDGIPLVWVGKMKGAAVERVTGPDFFDDVVADPRARLVRHYFYGGSPETTSRIVARAEKLLGKDAIAGWHAPPMRPPDVLEEPDILAEIRHTQPDVIWVGLSTPKQEYWMANHSGEFPNTVLVGIGAAFDYFAGSKSRAPVIAQRTGLEWLFRIFQEPRRLWPRYRRVVPGMLRILFNEARDRYL